MKAPNEYGWAAFLDALQVTWKYEALEPALSKALRYQPDFWLPDSLAWLEIKPERHTPTAGEARVARQLVMATGQPVYIVCGWPVAQKLYIRGYFKSGPEQWSKGSLAVVWLATLLSRRPGDVTRAGAEVMKRHYEFVRAWRNGGE